MILPLKLVSKLFKKSILKMTVNQNEDRKVNIKGVGSLYDLMDSYPLILSTLFSELQGYNYVIKRNNLATKLLVKAIINLEEQNNIYVSPKELIEEYNAEKENKLKEI